MIVHKKRREKQFLIQLEEVKEKYVKRASELDDIFYCGFYIQCAESTAADIYEMLFLDFSKGNCFQNVQNMEKRQMERFFKLAAIHHSICTTKRRKKQIKWQCMQSALKEVYRLSEREMQMSDVLYRCICISQSGFSELFAKVTIQYLRLQSKFDILTLAFLLHFWYNSYRSFLASFVGYVPFHIRLKKASAM